MDSRATESGLFQSFDQMLFLLPVVAMTDKTDSIFKSRTPEFHMCFCVRTYVIRVWYMSTNFLT